MRIKDRKAPTMNKLDTKRYSCDAPEPALERDVQVELFILGLRCPTLYCSALYYTAI
jgi:hypothetical protein